MSPRPQRPARVSLIPPGTERVWGRSRSAGAGMFGPQRYEQGEGGSEALGAAHGDLAVVGGHHVLDDGQPEAGAPGRARPRRADPGEAIEDPLQIAFGDTDALVGHAELGVAVRGLLGAD